MARNIVRKMRFKDRIGIGQVITSKRSLKDREGDPVHATIRQVWRKDRKAWVVFHNTSDDAVIPFDVLQREYVCKDWHTIYIRPDKIVSR